MTFCHICSTYVSKSSRCAGNCWYVGTGSSICQIRPYCRHRPLFVYVGRGMWMFWVGCDFCLDFSVKLCVGLPSRLMRRCSLIILCVNLVPYGLIRWLTWEPVPISHQLRGILLATGWVKSKLLAILSKIGHILALRDGSTLYRIQKKPSDNDYSRVLCGLNDVSRKHAFRFIISNRIKKSILLKSETKFPMAVICTWILNGFAVFIIPIF